MIFPILNYCRLGVLLLLLSGWALSALAQDAVRIRDTGTKCGLYVTPLDNTSNGFRVADLHEGSIREYILSSPDLDNKALFLVGTPVYGKQKKVLTQVAKLALQEVGKKGTPVRVIRHPKNMGERIRMLWFMPEDFQVPTKSEVGAAVQKVFTADAAPLFLFLAIEDWWVAIPVGLVNMFQGVLSGVYRRTLSNYQVRSHYTAERYIKQLILGTIFTLGIYFAKNYADLPTLLNLLDPADAAGMAGTIVNRIWAGVVFSTLWRTLFHNGVYSWEESMTQRGRDEDGRRTAARLELLASLINVPGWIYSTISQDYLFDLGVMKLNIGHMVMLGTSVVGAAIWKYPHLLNPSVKILDSVFGKINGVWLATTAPFRVKPPPSDAESPP